VQPGGRQPLLAAGPLRRLRQKSLEPGAGLLPHRTAARHALHPYRRRLRQVPLHRVARDPHLQGHPPGRKALHQHFVPNHMNLIHPQHPPRGRTRDVAAGWISFRAAFGSLSERRDQLAPVAGRGRRLGGAASRTRVLDAQHAAFRCLFGARRRATRRPTSLRRYRRTVLRPTPTSRGIAFTPQPSPTRYAFAGPPAARPSPPPHSEVPQVALCRFPFLPGPFFGPGGVSFTVARGSVLVSPYRPRQKPLRRASSHKYTVVSRPRATHSLRRA